MNRMENQEQRLKEALQHLPQYQPAGSLWKAIAAELEREEREKPLQDALKRLPSYIPPTKVWQGIETALWTQAATRHRRLRFVAWAGSAAAALALLLAIYHLQPSQDESLQIAYSYQTESALSPTLYQPDWDDDEAALQEVAAHFVKAPVAQLHPQYELLREEWEALDEAKREVLEFMKRYGNDGALIRQLATIERERSALARQMASQI
jgi:hypothetical protein